MAPCSARSCRARARRTPESGTRRRQRAVLDGPVTAEPPVPRQNPPGPERDRIERDERDGPKRHLGPRSGNHLEQALEQSAVADRGASAATRVPHATIVQNTPMILYEANVSTSAALMDAAVTASAAPYTIARRSGSVSARTARASSHTSA